MVSKSKVPTAVAVDMYQLINSGTKFLLVGTITEPSYHEVLATNSCLVLDLYFFGWDPRWLASLVALPMAKPPSSGRGT